MDELVERPVAGAPSRRTEPETREEHRRAVVVPRSGIRARQVPVRTSQEVICIGCDDHNVNIRPGVGGLR